VGQTDPAEVSSRPWLAENGPSRTNVQRVLRVAWGLVIIGGIVAVNEVVFRVLLDTSYVRWYLANGALITLAAGLVTFGWGDVNKLTGLISAHPVEYRAACLMLIGVPLIGFSSLVRVNTGREASRRRHEAAIESDRKLEAAWDQDKIDRMPPEPRQRMELLRHVRAEMAEQAWSRESQSRGFGAVDGLIGTILGAAFLMACAAWLWVVAPLQYVVNLVAGSPARLALTADSRVWFRVDPLKIEVAERDADSSPPKGLVETGFSARPVAFTTLVAAGLLFLASFLV
jgi:hypothetical protein